MTQVFAIQQLHQSFNLIFYSYLRNNLIEGDFLWFKHEDKFVRIQNCGILDTVERNHQHSISVNWNCVHILLACVKQRLKIFCLHYILWLVLNVRIPSKYSCANSYPHVWFDSKWQFCREEIKLVWLPQYINTDQMNNIIFSGLKEHIIYYVNISRQNNGILFWKCRFISLFDET